MTAASDMVMSLHFVLVLSFVGVTSLLMLITVVNRLRIRHVVLSWWGGRLHGLPVWPLLFTVLLLVFFGYSLLNGHHPGLTLFAGYLSGAVFWFVAALFGTMVLVTENGILMNVNNAERVVAWGQIVDYFEFEKGKRCGFVFFYTDACNHRRRLEVFVPRPFRERFAAIVREQIDARFDYSVRQAYGKKALEG